MQRLHGDGSHVSIARPRNRGPRPPAPRAGRDHHHDPHGRIGEARREGPPHRPSPRPDPEPGPDRAAHGLPGRRALRRGCRPLPPRHRGRTPGTGLRVRPVLLALDCARGPAAPPARGGLRVLPRAPAHPLPARGRPGGRQDDYGWAAPQGAQDPRPRPAHADRRARESHLPVAAGDEGQVPRDLRGDARRDPPESVRPEPLAGEEPSRDLGVVDLANRGRQGEPAPQPLGSRHRGRGPQDECLQPREEDARLPARRGAFRTHRPLPADDGDAPQGRPGELPPVSLSPRPRTSTAT